MDIPYTLIRTDRKTVSLRILPDGQVEVRAPRRLPKGDIDRFVSSKQDWIRKNRARVFAAAERAGEPYTEDDLKRMADDLTRLLPPLLNAYSERLRVTYGRVTVRRQRTRWGSCSSNGNLNFNCLIAEMPDAVRRYLVVHELCHRLEMNHSGRFWRLVESVCPDYRTQEAWLKTEGRVLLARLPR